MSRATGGARPWNENEGRVAQRHMPPPPISALIDAPRQSNFRLRASLFAAIITTAATPNSHPDCRALLIQIVALQQLDQISNTESLDYVAKCYLTERQSGEDNDQLKARLTALAL